MLTSLFDRAETGTTWGKEAHIVSELPIAWSIVGLVKPMARRESGGRRRDA
ncbi:hypothetical protein [Mesorhizobium sp. M0590]|uniref:hypothetical protein n=1 Tax=Mesorhizobium sp. M0590 TaxID=2956966 RepID=UPI0033353E27